MRKVELRRVPTTRVARYLASNFELASWRCSFYWRSPSKLRTFRLAR